MFPVVSGSANVVLPLILGAILLTILPWTLRKNIVDKDGHPIPPGPLLRYAFLRGDPERSLHVWAKRYGPLFSVWMGNQLCVVISDPQVARDLFVTNGSIFSSRKEYFMKNQLILRGRAITASQYGDRWRQHRRLVMHVLAPKAVQKLGHILENEARDMISSLVHETKEGVLPINPALYIGRFTFNNLLMISFGIRSDSISDPLFQRLLAFSMEFMELTGPLSNIIDFIEPLQKLPSYMKSRGHKLHEDLIEVYGAMILRVKARMDAGEDVPDCLVKTLLETQEDEKLDWEDLCMLCAVFIFVVHSTSSTIQWFLALITLHPEIQAQAHAELDRVVGQENWPTPEDGSRLPYIRAIIKEVQRTHAPFWIPAPHYSTDDFVYNGMYIPKGTLMVLDCYTIHHNEERYPDPFTFNPDRYLGDNLSCAESVNLSDAMQRDHWTFGVGRRICPGITLAERMLWLAISRLLWSFTIHEVPREPISLKECSGAFGRTPLPYRVNLLPRHDTLSSVLVVDDEMNVKI
ncbi:hypothetical protein NLI96_g7906 [Meripilus lineatus]|uniref:Cytochrome P450 n=1 Tax=Meripilus lineatus TaxID=2056292 RepID=A0AAD5V079_9APHY|nr:hypothetical protein NLI96_g7906 [Physisporinus lineatus]